MLTLRHVTVRSSVRGGYGFPLAVRKQHCPHRILDSSSRPITTSLRSEFSMTDMGSLLPRHRVTRNSFGMHLSQAKYAVEILDNADMTACKSTMTPVDTPPKLSAFTALPWPTRLSTGVSPGSPVPHLHAP
jgi:hypothetical protein